MKCKTLTVDTKISLWYVLSQILKNWNATVKLVFLVPMPPFTLFHDSPDVLKNVDLHPFLDSLLSLLCHNFIEFKILRFKGAFIIGRIDYCNSLLFGLPSVHVLKLQPLQNAAARLISNVPRYSHITPVLCSLHWLPVKFRIDFKILLFYF